MSCLTTKASRLGCVCGGGGMSIFMPQAMEKVSGEYCFELVCVWVDGPVSHFLNIACKHLDIS